MLEDQFAGLDQASKDTLADLPTTQQKALAALLIAGDDYDTPWLDAGGICIALRAAGVALSPNQIGPALSRPRNLVARQAKNGATQYRLMTAGRRVVEAVLSRTALSVMYVEAGKPRTARKQLAALLAPLTGDVQISDPYYGVRTLDSLALLISASSVRFLTARTNEKQAEVARVIGDFRREHPNIDLRVASNPSSMHDRYIISDDTLILVGHGLKDIGGKESFVIRLDSQMVEDIVANMRAAFDAKWLVSAPL
jgi:hypothetical protein